MEGYMKLSCVEDGGISVETRLRHVSPFGKIAMVKALCSSLEIDKEMFTMISVMFDALCEQETVINVDVEQIERMVEESRSKDQEEG